jgi:hypothetical protein
LPDSERSQAFLFLRKRTRDGGLVVSFVALLEVISVEEVMRAWLLGGALMGEVR